MAAEPIPATDAVQGSLFPFEAVRVETVLSRNPVHNLAKRHPIEIAIHVADDEGASELHWQVSYNSRYGPPGPLAYKLDTLIVNRRLDEEGLPTPKLLRLGTLREICAELGVNEGQATQDTKRALLQNASAFINARFRYRGKDGGEQTFEFADTRYGVIFTGQKFPDGRKANAVYLVLHDLYRALVDRAPQRPLNYGYLKSLTPSAQRFYELVSYQIYAAILHRRRQARYRYSELCTFAPQARYFDWEQVRKQMHKLHKPHLESGYLESVSWEPAEEGEPDWWFWYTPGPKAYADYNASLTRPRRQRAESARSRPSAAVGRPEWETVGERAGGQEPPLEARPEPKAGPVRVARSGQLSLPTPLPQTEAADQELVEALVASELNRADAERLAREKPEECRRQLEHLPFVTEFRSSRGAYLRSAIEGGYGPPRGYGEQKAREAAGRRKQVDGERQKARQRHEEAHREAYLEWLGEQVGELEKTEPGAIAAFREAEGVKLASYRKTFPPESRMLATALADFERTEVRAVRLREFFQKQYPALQLPDFWAWDTAHNPDRFQPE